MVLTAAILNDVSLLKLTRCYVNDRLKRSLNYKALEL